MASVPELQLPGNNNQWLVSMGIKLLTLRMDSPKYAGFQPGEYIITLFDYEGRDIGFVYNRQLKPLKDYTPAELLLDGYWSTKEAVQSQRRFPGYGAITENTPMLGIGFSSYGHVAAYVEKEHLQTLFEVPLHLAVLNPVFHGLFLPTYLWWAILKHEDADTKLTVTKWHKLLSNHLGIFSKESLQAVRTVDEATEVFYAGLRHKQIKEILKYESTLSPRYKSLVLCQPVSITVSEQN